MNLRKLFGCKWEHLGKQRWMFGNENVPKWVHKKTLGMRPGTVQSSKEKPLFIKL